MTEITNTYELVPEGDTDSLVILLHGLGSNGRDLISLAPMWAAGLPNTVFVSPDAPFVCDMVPEGYPDAYQWFSLQDRDPHVVLQGVQRAQPILDSFITEQIEKYGVRREKTVLVGFSQGTMISLYAGPRYLKQLGGVLGYSGALCGEAKGHKIPVCLIHGEADDVVPFEAYKHARGKLIGAGFAVSGHSTAGLAHSIDQAGIEAGAAFLKGVLA
ncbi:MAG: alpha/beta hydrolase [Alphaproteobacteria bacterium]